MATLHYWNTDGLYITTTTASNSPDDPTEVRVTVYAEPPVSEEQADEPEHPRLRPPRPRRSSRPPAISVTFTRRPVNRHPSARRAFRY